MSHERRIASRRSPAGQAPRRALPLLSLSRWLAAIAALLSAAVLWQAVAQPRAVPTPAPARKPPAAAASVTPAPAPASAPRLAPEPAVASPVSVPQPVRVAPLAPASAGSSNGAPAGPALQLNYTRAVLPGGQVGTAYPPVALARGGSGGYRIVAQQGRLPAGLNIVEGSLAGTPTEAGRFDFMLEVQDGSSPPQSVRQAYSLVIARQRSEPATRKTPAAPASAPVPEVPAEVASSTLLPPGNGRIEIYRLRQEDLDAIVPPPDGGTSPPDDKPPDAAQLAKETVDLLRKLQATLDDAGLPRNTIDDAAWEASTQAPPPAAATAASPRAVAGSAPAAAASAPAATRAPPSPAQLREMLQPLVDVEYPSEALFAAAVRGRQCGYMVELLRKGFRDREGEAKLLPRIDCPRPLPVKTAAARSTDKRVVASAWTLREFHDWLLPEDVRQLVTEKALVPIPRDKAADVRWRPADCDCAQPIGVHDIVYGVHPFWRSGEVGKEPLIEFNRFHRISVLGVQFNEQLELAPPPEWRVTISRLARDAHRHDTELDLLLQRSDWRGLRYLNADQVNAQARKAAGQAFRLFNDTLASNLPDLRPLLLPWWSEPDRAFSGITIMFTDEPPGARDAADPTPKLFDAFYSAFVLELIELMKKSERPVTLNLLVPDQQVGRDGPFSWYFLMKYIHLAEKSSNPNIPEGSNPDVYRPRHDPGNDITLRLIVPLSEPTTLSKKELRRRIDDTDNVRGHDRVALLDSIVPLLFNPAGPQAQPLRDAQRSQLEDDMAYFRHNFGGVGMWPVPVRDVGAGKDVLCLLEQNFFEKLLHAQDCKKHTVEDENKPLTALSQLARQTEARVCSWVCPNRSPLRLLWQGLALAAVLGIVVWRTNCALRRFGPWVLVTLWLLALLAAVIGGGLMVCDPELRTLREGNVLLYLLLVAIAVVGLWFSIKPRVLTP